MPVNRLESVYSLSSVVNEKRIGVVRTGPNPGRPASGDTKGTLPLPNGALQAARVASDTKPRRRIVAESIFEKYAMKTCVNASTARDVRLKIARLLEPDLPEVADEALRSWIVPPICDDRLQLGQRAKAADVALDRARIGRARCDLGVEVVDRRVRRVFVGERSVQLRERKQRLRLRDQLLSRNESGRIGGIDRLPGVVHSVVVHFDDDASWKGRRRLHPAVAIRLTLCYKV